MIRTNGLTKIFQDRKHGELRAVDDVSFTCDSGIVYGLLGPNGAGKTTTLRILSTALRPTSGTALVNGVDVTRDPQKVRMQIGFLSGTTGLYGRLSPREMVTYFGRLYGMPIDHIDRRIGEIFEMLDMEQFAETRNDNLSTGMKQKASIARSVVHDPPVMIFDEPTTGLDVMSSRTIVKFIRHCADQGKTVIFSTHIMSEAVRLCDRIGIIHRGRLYAEGTSDELLQKTGSRNLEDAFVSIVGE
ncbi:MAG TPA: ATP-binding cassette domain-containing protein [candidate division Zixibacteria bacterium]